MAPYLQKALRQFDNIVPTKCQDSPYPYTEPKYGAKQQFAEYVHSFPLYDALVAPHFVSPDLLRLGLSRVGLNIPQSLFFCDFCRGVGQKDRSTLNCDIFSITTVLLSAELEFVALWLRYRIIIVAKMLNICYDNAT